jgi:hypothetical protein
MNFEGGKCKAKVLTTGLRIVNFLQLGELLFLINEGKKMKKMGF